MADCPLQHKALADQAMLAKDGRALAGHYLFPYFSFTLGHVHSFPDRQIVDAACTDQIARFEKVDVRSDIHMAECEIAELLKRFPDFYAI